MQVILLERIEKLGQMGDVVTVKPGFARNYLLPSKKAMRATKANIEVFEQQRQQLEAANLKAKGEAEQVAAKLDGLKVVVLRSAGDSGQLYGSVNARDISDAVTEAGFTIQRNQVVLERPVKALGLFDLRIRLHPEVSATVTANVARSAEEAAEQERLGRAFLSAEAEEAAAEEEAAAAREAAEAMFEPEAAEAAAAALQETVEEVEEATASGDDTQAPADADTPQGDSAESDSDEKSS
ncbi:MAG: 50S ribosomal protein L9 [Alphaproteobacteria bacterium]|nr:50S ribosomal protein L9 [Alphaproteobacteria bacterium]